MGDIITTSPSKTILINYVHRAYNGEVSQTPQLGLMYIATSIEQSGLPVEIIHGDDIAHELKKKINPNESYLIGFYCNSDNIESVKRICKKIKEKYSNVTTILGGPIATLLFKDLIKYPQIDLVCRGDGELLTVEILTGKNPKNILGLSYKENNVPIHNPPRPPEKDLDRYPIPNRSIYPTNNIYERMTLSTSRGCGFRCTFCFESIQRQIRFHSIDRIIEEIKTLKKEYRLKYITFSDDIFTTHQRRLLKICEEIRKNFNPFKDIYWYCEARVDSLASNPELIPEMKKSGLARIQIGTESGDQEVIDLYLKKITIQQIKEAVKQCNNHQVQSIFTNFILGGPKESKKTFQKTKDLITELINLAPGRFECSSNFLSPYPGTDIYNNPNKYGLKIIDSDFHTDLSGNYVCTETLHLNKRDLIEMQRELNEHITIEMIKLLPNISPSLIREHLIRSTEGLSTQWSALFLEDPYLSNWTKFIAFSKYSYHFEKNSSSDQFPIRTFPLTDIKEGQLNWHFLGKSITLGKLEIEIVHLMSGKLNINDIMKTLRDKGWGISISKEKFLNDISQFVSELVNENLALIRKE